MLCLASCSGVVNHPPRSILCARILVRYEPRRYILSKGIWGRCPTICPVCSERYLRLGHKFVDVVVVSVVNAVDVVEPSVPTRPLPIANPSLGEGRYPDTIGVQAVAEIEVLHLHPMLAGHHAIGDVLMFANGGEGRIVLDPAQHVRYTGGVHKFTPYGPGLGVLSAPPGPSLYPTPSLYNIVWYSSTDCGNIL